MATGEGCSKGLIGLAILFASGLTSSCRVGVFRLQFVQTKPEEAPQRQTEIEESECITTFLPLFNYSTVLVLRNEARHNHVSRIVMPTKNDHPRQPSMIPQATSSRTCRTK